MKSSTSLSSSLRSSSLQSKSRYGAKKSFTAEYSQFAFVGPRSPIAPRDRRRRAKSSSESNGDKSSFASIGFSSAPFQKRDSASLEEQHGIVSSSLSRKGRERKKPVTTAKSLPKLRPVTTSHSETHKALLQTRQSARSKSQRSDYRRRPETVSTSGFHQSGSRTSTLRSSASSSFGDDYF